MARTNNLSNFLTDVAGAIRTKKGSEEPIAAEDFDTEIENLPSGGDLSEYFASSIDNGTESQPGYIKAIKKIPAFTLASTVGRCDNMFYKFQGEEIDLSLLDTSNVTDMSAMFRACTNLKTLDFSNFDTRNVVLMNNMFRGCEVGLEELDLSSFYTPKLTRMNYMFQYDAKLKKIDMRNFTFDNATSSDSPFLGIPADCLIIVKSQTEKDWVLARRSDLTNVKTVAEYEAEQNA